MRSLVSFGIVSFTLVACGSSAPPPSAPTTAAPVATAAASPANSILPIAEASIVSADGKHMATLQADGKLVFDGKVGLTITSDGQALDEKGQLITTIDKDGKVGTRGLTITEDGTVKAPDGQHALTLAADGTITDDKGKSAPIKIKVSDPKGRRAVMFAFMLINTRGNVTTTSGPGCPMNKGSKMSGTPTGCACEDSNQGKKYELSCDDAKGCVCKVDGKQTVTLSAAAHICDDQTVWSKCGFPEHMEQMKPSY